MRGAVLLATAVTLLFAAVQSARTATQQGTKAGHEAKRCGILANGPADYRIKARKLTCRFAKKWSRAYLNSRSAAPAFDCYRAGTNVTFYCANGAKAYWAERLTATAANHPGHGPVRVDVGGLAFKRAGIAFRLTEGAIVLARIQRRTRSGGDRLGISTSSRAKAATAPACRCAASHRAATGCA